MNLFPLEEGERPDLATLKARNLPHCTPESIGFKGKVKEGTEEARKDLAEIVVAFTDYLMAFLPPGSKCPKCNADLTGFLTGSFRWDVCYGEGKCGVCGYPCRAYHRVVREGDTKPLMEFGMVILAYHPDVLESNKDRI